MALDPLQVSVDQRWTAASALVVGSTCSAREKLTIPLGEEAAGDPMDLTVAGSADLVLSLYFLGEPVDARRVVGAAASQPQWAVLPPSITICAPVMYGPVLRDEVEVRLVMVIVVAEVVTWPGAWSLTS
jgi:hypothetical protein